MDTTLQKTRRFPFGAGAFTRFLARLLLAGVFATAATAKLGSMRDFERTLLASKLVPSDLTHAAAAAIISLELVITVCEIMKFTLLAVASVLLFLPVKGDALTVRVNASQGTPHLVINGRPSPHLFQYSPAQTP